jgi:peptidoglycan/LPS O-acetylase OafA/YrhL
MSMNAGSVRKYDFIDVLRGFAILAVILFHTGQIVPPTSQLFAQVSGNGFLGVQLFFITSALTLCLSMNARQKDEASPTRNFFIRRFFRIAPMFYLAEIFFLLINGTGPHYWSPSGIHWWQPVLTFFFLHGWHPETIDSVVPGGWSIAVEMTFYLLLPMLFVALKDIKSTLLFIVFTVVLAWDLNKLMTLLYTPMYPQNEQYLVSSFTYFWLPSQLPVFGLGILLYHIFKRYKNLQDRSLGLVLLLVAVLALLGFSQSDTYKGLLPQHFLMGIGFCFLALGLYFSHLKVLINPITVWIGKLSYSMYLVHFAILKLMNALYPHGFPLKGTAGTLVAFFLVAGATILVSAVTYNFIEKPGIRMGSTIIRKLEQTKIQTEAAD